MDFGPVKTKAAIGHVLAHSIGVASKRLPKGKILSKADILLLEEEHIEEVIVARLSETDLGENEAALQIAECLAGPNIRLSEPVAGRVNLIAKTSGLFFVSSEIVLKANSVDESITIATLGDKTRAMEGTLLCTIKIIPYGVSESKVEDVKEILRSGALSLNPFNEQTYDLIITQTDGFKSSLIEKGRKAIASRCSPLGLTEGNFQLVPHKQEDVAHALKLAKCDTVLILGASATSDRRDVVPAALTNVGGHIERFGMPVDPGNLLLLGALGERPVIGLPGCARAPALNGVDWVLERIAAKEEISSLDIATLGVGGLLKEIPQRGLPRLKPELKSTHVSALVMAAGSSSRMNGDHKLLKEIDGTPLVRRYVEQVLASKVDDVLVVTPTENAKLKSALEGLPVKLITCGNSAEGLSASIRAGISATREKTAHYLLCFADMPDIDHVTIDKVLSATSKAETGQDIVVPIDSKGKRGHPVLFDRRYKELLQNLKGDTGAKSILAEASERVLTVKIGDEVTTDLDTPEAWIEWERMRTN